MKKYAVAFYSNFTGEMEMSLVFATSEVEACKAVLRSEDFDDLDHIKTYKDAQQFAFDTDHAIGAIATVDGSGQKSPSLFQPSMIQ